MGGFKNAVGLIAGSSSLALLSSSPLLAFHIAMYIQTITRKSTPVEEASKIHQTTSYPTPNDFTYQLGVSLGT